MIRSKNYNYLLVLLFFLSGKAAAELSEAFSPYPAGSLYNLGKYLPWNDRAPAIVPYPTGCSVNSLADFAVQLIFPKSRGSFSKVFHAECVRHDLCYRHGSYTYQFSKDDCDNEFSGGLQQRCAASFDGEERIQCQRVAEIISLAARKFGHLSYHANDYPFRDYGYYFEYLDKPVGQYALLWSLLDPKADVQRQLFREKVNNNQPLPPGNLTRVWIRQFFEKKISLDRLLNRLKSYADVNESGPSSHNHFSTR